MAVYLRRPTAVASLHSVLAALSESAVAPGPSLPGRSWSRLVGLLPPYEFVLRCLCGVRRSLRGYGCMYVVVCRDWEISVPKHYFQQLLQWGVRTKLVPAERVLPQGARPEYRGFESRRDFGIRCIRSGCRLGAFSCDVPGSDAGAAGDLRLFAVSIRRVLLLGPIRSHLAGSCRPFHLRELKVSRGLRDCFGPGSGNLDESQGPCGCLFPAAGGIDVSTKTIHWSNDRCRNCWSDFLHPVP